MPVLGQTNSALQVIGSAVTPVVMVSANAILISGVNSRYIAIADRVRSLTREHREASTSAERRAIIRRQLKGFQRRVRLVSWSMRALYMATACFVTMALLISATLWRRILADTTLPLFIAGILLVIFALICELIELQVSNSTLAIEIQDLEAGNEPR
jgi:hypothetical protein